MIDLIDVNNETTEFFDHFVSRIVWLSQHYHQSLWVAGLTWFSVDVLSPVYSPALFQTLTSSTEQS